MVSIMMAVFLTDKKEMEGVTNPTHYWVPSIGPCGAMIVTSDKYPEWKGNLLVGALALRHIARVELNDTSYVKEEKLLNNVAASEMLLRVQMDLFTQ